MWSLKKMSLIFLVILLIPVSGVRAQCPKNLDGNNRIKLARLKMGNTFTDGGYVFSEGKRENVVTFDHRKLWALMEKPQAIYTVTLEQQVAGRPNATDCIYQVSESGTPVTKLLIHGEKQ
jgi:hypothetical protein